MTIYPSIRALKQKLQIAPINTGKQFSHNGQASGIIYNDVEGLNAVVGERGCVHLKSGVEFQWYQYRGQIKDYGLCVSTLDRCESIKAQLLNICRTIAFEELLQVHPFVSMAKTFLLLNNPICINLTGIAQHYGLHTDYLDITNNFDVACFFATCQYRDGEYFPIRSMSKPGVIYRINELLHVPFLAKEQSSEVELEYLGWQPLTRPEQQRASVLRLKKNTNLDTVVGVEKYYFRHSPGQSKRIWRLFDKGKALFPDDSAAELANECKKLKSFTKEQLEKAFVRLEHWSSKKIENYEQVIDSLNIEIVEDNHLRWDDLVEMNPEFWENKIAKIIQNVGIRLAYNV
ncbi:MAG: FRG domain-containing protein [Melioribacteraceae bacterium]|nr:FRG domain-containing protein [Melioribacteraceae bacterium]